MTEIKELTELTELTELREIAPDIFLLKIPLPLSVNHVNVYIFRGRIPTLLDTGTNTPEVLGMIQTALKQLGIKKLEQVLTTHWHVDHAGGALALAQQGARVYIGAQDYSEWQSFAKGETFELFRDWAGQEWEAPTDIIEGMIKIYDKLRRMTAWPEGVEKLEPLQTIQAGNYVLQSILTPGHTVGHLAFYEETQRMLFSGDMLLPDQVPYPGIWLEEGKVTSGLPSHLQSLSTMEKLKAREYYPAHGDPQANPEVRCQEVRDQIFRQVERYDPTVSVYEGALHLGQGKVNPGVLFMQLHYVYGWKKLYELENGRKKM